MRARSQSLSPSVFSKLCVGLYHGTESIRLNESVSSFLLPDYPHNTKSFSLEERLIARMRLDDDIGSPDNSDVGVLAGLKLAVRDWKSWAFGRPAEICMSNPAAANTFRSLQGFCK